MKHQLVSFPVTQMAWSRDLFIGLPEEAERPREIGNNIQMQASRGHWPE